MLKVFAIFYKRKDNFGYVQKYLYKICLNESTAEKLCGACNKSVDSDKDSNKNSSLEEKGYYVLEEITVDTK